MKRFVAGALAGALALALVAVAVAYFADVRIEHRDNSGTSEVPSVSVPNLVGEDVSEARAEVEAMGLEVRTSGGGGNSAWYETFETPYVIDQTPDGNTDAPVNATVTLELGER